MTLLGTWNNARHAVGNVRTSSISAAAVSYGTATAVPRRSSVTEVEV
jgi:hypothetical protein